MLPTRMASAFHAAVHDLKLARLGCNSQANATLVSPMRKALVGSTRAISVSESSSPCVIDSNRGLLPTRAASPWHAAVLERRLERLARAESRASANAIKGHTMQSVHPEDGLLLARQKAPPSRRGTPFIPQPTKPTHPTTW